MAYKTAEEFFNREKCKITEGTEYYTITQVARIFDVRWEVIRDWLVVGGIEKKLGLELVRHSYNHGKYFSKDNIRKIFQNRKLLLSGYLFRTDDTGKD